MMKKRVTLTLKEDSKLFLKKIAKERGMSASALVEEIFLSYIDKNKAKTQK